MAGARVPGVGREQERGAESGARQRPDVDGEDCHRDLYAVQEILPAGIWNVLNNFVVHDVLRRDGIRVDCFRSRDDVDFLFHCLRSRQSEFDGLAGLESNFRGSPEVAFVLYRHPVRSEIELFEVECAVRPGIGIPLLSLCGLVKVDMNAGYRLCSGIEYDSAEGQGLGLGEQEKKKC